MKSNIDIKPNCIDTDKSCKYFEAAKMGVCKHYGLSNLCYNKQAILEVLKDRINFLEEQ